MAIGLLKTTVTGSTGIVFNHYTYVNDALYEQIKNLSPSTDLVSIPAISTDYNEIMLQMKAVVDETFNDNQYWSMIEMPVHSTMLSYAEKMFPSAYSVLGAVSYDLSNHVYYELPGVLNGVYRAAIAYNNSSIPQSLGTYASLYTCASNISALSSTGRVIFFDINVIPSTCVDTANKLVTPPTDTSEYIQLFITYYQQSGRIRIFTGRTWTDVLHNTGEPYYYDEYIGGPGPGPTPPEEDPYSPGGESGEEGGEGDFDNTSDEIEIPALPTASTVINTGFITLYDANIYDLNDLASYLWSANGLDLETFKKIFADPISAILGLSIFPCSPEITTQDVNVILGNIDTGVGMRKVTNQYRRYDMGTLNLNEYWGGYLDYSPYTSVEIYLPYIGTRTLNADDVMGKALHLVYNIDFLSGSCCAILEVGGTVLYQFMGQCSCPVPVTGRDMTNLVNGVMSVVGAGVGTLVATGGNAALAGASAIGSLASHVTSSKPKIEKSGAMGGMGGMLGVRKPYLVVTRPRQALPASQNTYTGYPSYMTCMLGDLIGFTVMETVHLQDMSATDEEKAEIDRLLKTGVVL